jgi:hypothetical protein
MRERRLPPGIYQDRRHISTRFRVHFQPPDGGHFYYIGMAGSVEAGLRMQEQHARQLSPSPIVKTITKIEIPPVDFIFGIAFPRETKP